MSLLFHLVGPCGSILQWLPRASGIHINECRLQRLHGSQLPLPRHNKFDPSTKTSGRPSVAKGCQRWKIFTGGIYSRLWWYYCRSLGSRSAAVLCLDPSKCFVFSGPALICLILPEDTCLSNFGALFKTFSQPSPSLHFCRTQLNPLK